MLESKLQNQLLKLKIQKDKKIENIILHSNSVLVHAKYKITE
jgi:hypothetical protein